MITNIDWDGEYPTSEDEERIKVGDLVRILSTHPLNYGKETVFIGRVSKVEERTTPRGKTMVATVNYVGDEIVGIAHGFMKGQWEWMNTAHLRVIEADSLAKGVLYNG